MALFISSITGFSSVVIGVKKARVSHRGLLSRSNECVKEGFYSI